MGINFIGFSQRMEFQRGIMWEWELIFHSHGNPEYCIYVAV